MSTGMPDAHVLAIAIFSMLPATKLPGSWCSKGKAAEDLRGASYLLPLEEIAHRAVEAWERGATEVCMQVRLSIWRLSRWCPNFLAVVLTALDSQGNAEIV